MRWPIGSERSIPGAVTDAAEGPSRARSLAELAALFLRLGTTAFGGPAVHVALFEDEVVHRRRWLSRERFVDMLGATQMIPGPNSTEMAIHVGYERAGFPGVIVAGLSFILPAALITLAAAWAYVRFGSLPEATAFLYGAKPAIIAVVGVALWRLAGTALRSPRLALAGAAALLASALGVRELAVLFGTGFALLAARLVAERGAAAAPALLAFGVAPLAAGAGTAVFTLGALFLFFLKVGAVLFGSGYVLLAFLRADLVERWQWLTNAQLLDAIAVGQLTPGPVFTTATFVGYLLGGGPGALVATVGIFLPAFVYVALLAPVLPRLRRSALAGAFLDGVNAAAVALLAGVTWQLGRSALVDVPAAGLAVAGVVLLLRFRLNAAWLVLGGGAAGVVLALGGWGPSPRVTGQQRDHVRVEVVARLEPHLARDGTRAEAPLLERGAHAEPDAAGAEALGPCERGREAEAMEAALAPLEPEDEREVRLGAAVRREERVGQLAFGPRAAGQRHDLEARVVEHARQEVLGQGEGVELEAPLPDLEVEPVEVRPERVGAALTRSEHVRLEGGGERLDDPPLETARAAREPGQVLLARAPREVERERLGRRQLGEAELEELAVERRVAGGQIAEHEQRGAGRLREVRDALHHEPERVPPARAAVEEERVALGERRAHGDDA